ncbi:hypothetical protein CNR22_00540 [Sphingobacteriaceae bacterium]|nr:hypothetical protein CNR22_00540 [Sphingobacteriaceae bacterium]
MKKSRYKIGLLFFLYTFSLHLTAQLSFSVNTSTGTNTITCTNSLITLYVSSNYSGPLTYSWVNTVTGSLVSNSSSLALTNPGVFSITIASATSASSQTYQVTSNTTAPTVSLTSNLNALTCIINTVQLQASSNMTVTHFSWGSAFPCAPGPNCVAGTAGTYTVTGTNPANGCRNTATLSITNNKIYPAIIYSDPVGLACPDGTLNISPNLQSTVNLTYSWTPPFNVVATGLNSKTLTVNSPGNYNVVITNTSNGCASSGAIQVYVCLGIQERSLKTNFAVIYPVPVSDYLSIVLPAGYKNLDYKIINGLGKTLLSGSGNDPLTHISIETLENGLYMLELNCDGKTQLEKIIKLH